MIKGAFLPISFRQRRHRPSHQHRLRRHIPCRRRHPEQQRYQVSSRRALKPIPPGKYPSRKLKTRCSILQNHESDVFWSFGCRATSWRRCTPRGRQIPQRLNPPITFFLTSEVPRLALHYDTILYGMFAHSALSLWTREKDPAERERLRRDPADLPRDGVARAENW